MQSPQVGDVSAQRHAVPLARLLVLQDGGVPLLQHLDDELAHCASVSAAAVRPMLRLCATGSCSAIGLHGQREHTHPCEVDGPLGAAGGEHAGLRRSQLSRGSTPTAPRPARCCSCIIARPSLARRRARKEASWKGQRSSAAGHPPTCWPRFLRLAVPPGPHRGNALGHA